jgi:hypothetical protein
MITERILSVMHSVQGARGKGTLIATVRTRFERLGAHSTYLIVSRKAEHVATTRVQLVVVTWRWRSEHLMHAARILAAAEAWSPRHLTLRTPRRLRGEGAVKWLIFFLKGAWETESRILNCLAELDGASLVVIAALYTDVATDLHIRLSGTGLVT